MRAFIRIAIPLGLAAGSAFGASWTGKLIDAACHDRNPTGAAAGTAQRAPQSANGTIQDSTTCTPVPTTSSFALQTNEGQVFQFDPLGNAKAIEVFRKDPTKVAVTVTGTLDGEMIKVDMLDPANVAASSPARNVP